MKRLPDQSAGNPARAAFAARAMQKPLRAMKREIAGVRRNDDIECVHRMRVASRRLRNALDLFSDELPVEARDRWRKRLKGVTQSLGAARDLDVQIAFLRQYLDQLGDSRAKDRPGVEHVLATLTTRRDTAQVDVLDALDRLESSGTLNALADWLKEQPEAAARRTAGADDLRAEADRAARRRVADLFEYDSYVERPDAVKKLHAMRIAAKHLRYTLEVYAPLYIDGLTTRIQWMRQLQDWLGEIHDCDVWQVELRRMMKKPTMNAPSSDDPSSALKPLTAGMEHLRQNRKKHRAAVYEAFRVAWRQAANTDYWSEFNLSFTNNHKAPLNAETDPQPDDGATLRQGCKESGDDASSERTDHTGRTAGDWNADVRLRPALKLARSCKYEVGHTHQVAKLALRLFDRLARLHELDGERRFWLAAASLLHDIGWIEGRAGHHKTAMRLIQGSRFLPWDQRLRRIIGLIARFHRKAVPDVSGGPFDELSAADRDDVLKLAALLRIADALDYTHGQIVDDVACRVTRKRICIGCITTGPADIECDRAVEKGDLAVRVYDREIEVTWRLR